MNSFFISPKDAQSSITKSKERLKENLFVFNLLIDKEKKRLCNFLNISPKDNKKLVLLSQLRLSALCNFFGNVDIGF